MNRQATPHRIRHDQDPLRKSSTYQARAATWPLSLALMKREASGHGQPACRGGLVSEPPQHEAMEHQGQRDGEGGYHHQRIG
jgi:hypothetical protein